MLDKTICICAGQIFIWNKYPFFECEEKNRRWFLCLGSSLLEEILFQVTTTTRFEYYQQDGRRAKNNFFHLRAGMGGLEQDCIVDLTLYYEKRSHNDVNNSKNDIEPRSLLKQDQINTLIRHIDKDRDIIKIEKKNIYQYLRDSGFSVKI
jgi:hypothetical protein